MTALLEQIEADGIRLTITESGEVRVAGKRSLVERWAPTLRDRKPDLMAARFGYRPRKLSNRSRAATLARCAGRIRIPIPLR